MQRFCAFTMPVLFLVLAAPQRAAGQAIANVCFTVENGQPVCEDIPVDGQEHTIANGNSSLRVMLTELSPERCNRGRCRGDCREGPAERWRIELDASLAANANRFRASVMTPAEICDCGDHHGSCGDVVSGCGSRLWVTEAYRFESIDCSVSFLSGDGCDPCDANCDGSLNAYDIQSFIDIMYGETGCSPCAGDANSDGTLNPFDIQPFIDCLSR